MEQGASRNGVDSVGLAVGRFYGAVPTTPGFKPEPSPEFAFFNGRRKIEFL